MEQHEYHFVCQIELGTVLYSASWSKLNDHIAVCGSNNAITILGFNASSRALEIVKVFEEAHGSQDVNTVQWSPLADHPQLLLSGGDDHLVKIWSWQ